jgi:type VI protein secretion system component VasF
MTPLDLCEPLFLFVCKLNRSKRKGGPSFDPAQLRAEVDRILRTMVQRSTTERDLPKQFNLLKPALLAFVDGMAAQALSGKWQNMAAADQSGDDFFFKQLDVTLADTTPAARQRLAVFYTCLGLGFGEWKQDDARWLADKINQVAGHIQEFTDLDEKRKLCAVAYENIDERVLEPPLAQRLTSLGILLVGLLVIAFLANAMLYRQKTQGLNQIMNVVLGQDNSKTGN